MKALLNDLRLRDRRDLLKDILENSVPITLQDVVIVFVTVSGMRGGQLVQETYAKQDLRGAIGRPRTQRHPDYDGRRYLCRARHALRRPSAAIGSHQTGRDPAPGFPRQPFRSRLCDGCTGGLLTPA